MSQETIDVLRRCLGEGKSWVLFENGTVVVFPAPNLDLLQAAFDLLREWGPVHPGSPAGDFSVIELQDEPGWVVTSGHADILTYVAPDEVEEPEGGHLVVGLQGRMKRDRDAAQQKVVHVEPSRKR